MSSWSIRALDIGKRYRIGRTERYRTLRDSIVDVLGSPFRRVSSKLRGSESGDQNIVWALRHVSFEVAQGEVLGVIGRNGAGKTTLLKILSRITKPTEGFAEIRGRAGSLLEVGTGFHPELTGRENVYLTGAILGMKKAEIDHKFDDIVSFAEIEKFLDTPAKHYSSGMYVRLAFAVAAHLEPEILMVDEVLAVGDVAFQEKCLGKMGEVARSGRTILFVSHNLAAISALCSRAILFEGGELVATGSPNEVVSIYLNQMKPSSVDLRVRNDRQGNGRLRFVHLATINASGQPVEVAVSGQTMSVELAYESTESTPLKNVSVAIGVYDALGQFLFYCGNEMVGSQFNSISPRGSIVCRIPDLPLAPGRYFLNVYCEVNGYLADWIQRAGEVTVVEGDFFGTGRLPPYGHGGLLVPHAWTYQGS